MKTALEVMREERAGYMGGSDIGALYGVNPFKSRAALYAEKVGLRLPEDLSNKEAVIWGIEHEPAIIKQYAARTGAVLTLAGTIRHESYPFLAANVDAFLNEDGILEAKTATPRNIKHWGEQGSDIVPKHYYMQGTWYCGIAKRQYFVIAALLGGFDFRTYRFEFNPEHFEIMLGRAVDFWYDNVLPRVPPDPSEETFADDVKVLYPSDIPGTILETDPDEDRELIALCVEHEAAYLEKKAAEAKVKDIEARIKYAMQEHSALIVRGYSKPYTWKQNKDSVETDLQALAKECAVMIAKLNAGDATPYYEALNRFTTTKPGARPFFAPYSRTWNKR